MYINPQSNVRLLSGVPLDATYDHTIYFYSKSSQYNYFAGKLKYNLTNYSYVQVTKSVIRVGINIERLYQCNYIMFQNTAFGNKWFYAFISNMEYINNETTEITFEIDVMQTWFFEAIPDQCYIDREHSITDKIGEHIEPESINCGEYVYNGYGIITNAVKPMCVVIMISDNAEESDGNLYDGVYGGCTLFAYNKTDTEAIKAKINQYAQKPDAIVGMYMAPVIATGGAIPEGGIKIEYADSAEKLNIEQNAINDTFLLDGYKPKNKKLYTYPYHFLNISNNRESANYRYEFFTGLKATFDLNVGITMPVQCALRPKNYKNSGTNPVAGETLILSDYPMCSWNTDAFKAWLAQNALPIAVNAVQGGVGLVGNMVGIPNNLASDAGGKALSMLSQGYQASISADITKGSLASGQINVASGLHAYYGGRMSVTAEYARMIDDFFSVYGYACRRVKYPNRDVRPQWTYTKTLNCTITGNVPNDDMKKICSIYNNGVTFWKNPDNVGNYSLNNSV